MILETLGFENGLIKVYFNNDRWFDLKIFDVLNSELFFSCWISEELCLVKKW